MFKTNEGTIDRALRIIVGVVLLAMFFLYPGASWRLDADRHRAAADGACRLVPALFHSRHVHLPGEEGLICRNSKRKARGKASRFPSGLNSDTAKGWSTSIFLQQVWQRQLLRPVLPQRALQQLWVRLPSWPPWRKRVRWL